MELWGEKINRTPEYGHTRMAENGRPLSPFRWGAPVLPASVVADRVPASARHGRLAGSPRPGNEGSRRE